MTPSFDIQVDAARDLVRIRLAGFFDDATLRAFLHARKLAFERLRCGPNRHLSITDIRGMAIQAQDVVTRWHAVLADPAYASRRLAFVVASTLARTQLQRAIGSRYAQCFTDPDAAERWVLTGDDAESRAA